MLTVDMKVNGSTIGTIEVVNEGPELMQDAPPRTWRYSYRGCFFSTNYTQKPRVFQGKLLHVRDDGADTLLRKILECITENSGVKE